MTSLHRVESDKYARRLDHAQPLDSFRTAKLLLLLALVPALRASPISSPISTADHEEEGPSRWLYLLTSVILVLLGGAFAGLTIALMGQDEIYLQVIASSGDGPERAHASKVLKLMKKGKHWVLVTLLLSNVITNETLPIVLDRSLGGGWPAILTSTVLIVIFGEIAPQSICVRYGLPIGAWMAPFVLILMWVMAPVAWPVAKLLDYLLGEDHGTIYKKAGLKTLVTLHKTMGTSPDERLNQDEVTIISAVLDLKEKPVGNIMTPMDDAFTLSADTVLDEDMMDSILSAGYSRIPIHSPDNELNFVGMLLVKMLITYDPEDAMRVDDFALATLPETRPETSCLDIVNFFQEGKSHMVLVSDFPGESFGVLGVVTLEDVIEELIGEEIIDESDVYVDVHKAIRRMTPAPRNRVPKGKLVPDSGHSDDTYLKGVNGSAEQQPSVRQSINRSISASNANRNNKNNPSKMKEQFKLGPSNLASKPRQTRYSNFKIKPGVAQATDARPLRQTKSYYDKRSPKASPQTPQMAGSVGETQLASAGRDASDAVREVRQGYGTMDRPWTGERRNTDKGDTYKSTDQDEEGEGEELRKENSDDSLLRPSRAERGAKSPVSLSQSPTRQRHARSGSILEQTVDAGGIKKIVLEPNTDSDNNEDEANENNEGDDDIDALEKAGQNGDSQGQKENMSNKTASRKKKNSRKKKKKGGKNDDESSQPLLGGKD